MKKRSYPLDKLGKPLCNLKQPGYYPEFSTMKQKKFWDAATAAIVTERIEKIPPIRFFSCEEAALLEAIVDRMLPQDERAEERRIPIVPAIDERLFHNTLNGYRYEDMPPEREAYRMGIKAIDEMAQERFASPFADLGVSQQDSILKSLHDGQPDPEHPTWKRMPVHRFWAQLLDDCLNAYYSHPWAWDEIGFGGPAYPRGYMRLENGLPEPWETDEKRYEWKAPSESLSDLDSLRPSREESQKGGDEH